MRSTAKIQPVSIDAQRIKYLKENHWKCRSEMQELPENRVSHFFGTKQMSWMQDSILESNRHKSPDPQIQRAWLKCVTSASIDDFEALEEESLAYSNVSSSATADTENIPSANFLEDLVQQTESMKSSAQASNMSLLPPACPRLAKGSDMPCRIHWLRLGVY